MRPPLARWAAPRAQHAAMHDMLPAVPSSKEPYAPQRDGVGHRRTGQGRMHVLGGSVQSAVHEAFTLG
ncbi:hypothetical protein [Variovorax sp. DXTD-1]|uniref:hypothetical protein n=1 Tax=Variovorax sp. DXTD-1 TaxID=2495592 RepID=UPI000F866118|nr:hypothetical protein [Variovorax sp. DXTD-1]RST47722.1 hypothetical protein EJI00_18700 [Variovorax sp. DXTD-1]